MSKDSDNSRTHLGPAFIDALAYAAELHACQPRKGGAVPYVAHLMSVSALVIEERGTETQAVAALLHDAAEDQGGEPRLAEIERRFGAEVAAIVRHLSDSLDDPKPPWRERKERYVAHMRETPDDALLISLADKLDNARAILRDSRIAGLGVWDRFEVKDPEDQLWYYRSLLAVFRERIDSWMVEELERVVEELGRLAERSVATEHEG